MVVKALQAQPLFWQGRQLLLGLVLLFLGWAGPPAAQAADFPITSFKASAGLGIERIVALPAQQWQAAPPELAFGIQPQAAIWLKLQLPEQLPPEPYLVIFRANLKSVCLFSQPLGHWQQSCVNAHTPSLNRDFNAAEPVFALDPALRGQTVYLRVQSQNYIHVPLELLPKSALASKILLKQMLDFGAMGTLLSMTLLNLILAVWLRDKIYAWQALAVLSWGVYWFGGLMGYSTFWGSFWQNLFAKMPHFLGGIACLSSFFAFHIFAQQELDKWGHFFLSALKLLLGLTLLAVLLENPSLSLQLARVWGIALLFGMVAGLVWSLQTKKYLSAFYLSCWFFFYSSLLCVIMIQFQLLSFHYFTYSLFSWLQCLSMLSLTLVLAVKLRLLRQTHQKLLLSNLRLVEAHKQDLEIQVAERTEALQFSLKKLEEADQSKNRLFAILAHDLRSPFHSLISMLHLVERKADMLEVFQSILPRCRQQVTALSSSLDNMLTWAQAEIKGYPTHQEVVNVKSLFAEIVDLYAPAAEQKQISLHLQLEGEPLIRADIHHARLIFRNLVNNAVKFTPTGGDVTLGSWRQRGEVVLYVEDTGLGMSLQELDAILKQAHTSVRNGTSGERGVGLGMQLCQAYLKANQAKMLITSQEGIGTRVELLFQSAPLQTLSETQNESSLLMRS